VTCPGCGEVHFHKVPTNEDLSLNTLGKELGYFESDCANDLRKRRKIGGYWLVYSGVEK